nr:hypothetical protein B0A51_12443 [Rachicladosporium sp. CCFEE 5018]
MAAVQPDRLSSLPPELLLKILALLPPRDLCRLRPLSGFFAAFVALHKSSLAHDTVTTHRTRLRNRFQSLLSLAGLDLIGIIDRYYGYYGDACFAVAEESGRRSYPILSGMFMISWHLRPEALRNIDKQAFQQGVYESMVDFLFCHRYMHGNLQDNRDTDLYDAATYLWATLEHTAVYGGIAEENAEYFRAKVQDKSLFKGPRYGDSNRRRVPRFPITPRLGYEYPRCPMYNRFCRRLLFTKILQLPSLWPGLAYFVKSARMEGLVYAACTHETPEGTRLMKSPLFQATLLEETFLI